MNRLFHRAMPQNVHLMPKGARKARACGATTGGYIRVADDEGLRKFLRDGGGLCPECAKTAPQTDGG